MNYAKDDIHWWSSWFNQFMMQILALVFRSNNATAGLDIKLSVAEVFIKHLFGAFLIRQLYFNSKFQFKLNTKVMLALTFFLNTLLVFRYMELSAANSKWWATFVIMDIVLYYSIFLQMLVEWRGWPMKLLKWRQDLIFDQRFRAMDDKSENFVREGVATMVDNFIENVDKDSDYMENLVNEKLLDQHLHLDADDDLSILKTKELKLNGTIYTCAYVSFIRSNKKQYRLAQEDQFDILWKALFMLAFQVFFIHALVSYARVTMTLHNTTALQLCLFFTTLLLHFSCVPGARSGVYMMKYCLAHPD